MAKQGNFTAFQRLQPTQGISRDIQFWNQDAAYRRQEERVDENTKYTRETAEKQRKRDYYDKNIKPLNNYDSGSASLNEATARLLTAAQKEYLPILETKYNSEPGSEAYIKADLALANLQQLPEKLLFFTKAGTQEHNAYLKAVQEGAVYRDAEYEKRYQNGWKGIQLGYDENFNPNGAFTDIDSDGVLDVVSFDQYQSGQTSFTPVTRHNFEAIAQSTADEVGTIEDTNVTKGGYGTSRTKGPKIKFIETTADKLFTVDASGNLSSYAKSALIDAGMPLDKDIEKNLQTIRNAFIEDVKGRTDTEEEDTQKVSVSNLNSKNPSLKPTAKGTVTPSLETYGQENLDTFDAGVKNVNVTNVTFDVINDTDGNPITDATIKNFTYNKEGQIVVDYSYQDSKDTTFGPEEENFLKELIESRAEDQNKLAQAKAENDDGKNKAQISRYEKKIEATDLVIKRLKTGPQNLRGNTILTDEDQAVLENAVGGKEAAMKLANFQQGNEEDVNNQTFTGGKVR